MLFFFFIFIAMSFLSFFIWVFYFIFDVFLEWLLLLFLLHLSHNYLFISQFITLRNFLAKGKEDTHETVASSKYIAPFFLWVKAVFKFESVFFSEIVIWKHKLIFFNRTGDFPELMYRIVDDLGSYTLHV